jgi:hypothetical protein
LILPLDGAQTTALEETSVAAIACNEVLVMRIRKRNKKYFT